MNAPVVPTTTRTPGIESCGMIQKLKGSNDRRAPATRAAGTGTLRLIAGATS